MKFLIAALFLCLALVGQIQGGSLRGLLDIIPHTQYGVPLLSSGIQTEEIEPIADEIIKHQEPTTFKPFINDLPLIDSAVNFGYSSGIPASHIEHVTPKAHIEVSNSYLPPFVAVEPKIIEQDISNTYLPPKPELPLLQPGIPALPATPIVPLTIEEPIKIEQTIEVSADYLPPKPEILTTPTTELSNTYLPPKPVIPLLQPGLPSLPEAPKVPITIEAEAEVELSNTYLPPKPELPSLPEVPHTFTIEQITQADLSNTYLPPKSELPLLQPGLPSLPEAPKVPHTIAIEQPIEAHVELSNTYLPPKPELPLLQPGLPLLPEAPKIPITIAIEEPIEAHVETVSSSYLPPTPEIPLPQSDFPTLPETPVVPVEESKIGYTYTKPLETFIETAPVFDEIKTNSIIQAPVIDHQTISQIHITPDYIQPAQQIFIQPSVPSQQILIDHSLQTHHHQLFVHPSPQEQQFYVQPAFPTQQVFAETAVNIAPLEQMSHHGYTYNPPKAGYSYNPPKVEFPLPNEH